jgi:predicted dehydrogenase
MERKLRGAIIGCGFFGAIQLEAWNCMPDVNIVAACDADIHRASAAAPHGYRSAAEMLEEEQLDFVDIATRPDSHSDLVSMTLQRGIPTICQKPMATSLAHAFHMADLADSTGTRLMIHENWRWQPWYRAVKHIIAAGTIGNPVGYYFRVRQRDGLGPNAYPNQPYFREMPRLLIYETLIHHIDTASFLFGKVQSVYARARRYNTAIRGDDRALLTLCHESEVDGVIDGHRFLNPDTEGPGLGECWLEGDEARLFMTAGGDIYRKNERIWSAPASRGYKGDSVLAVQRHFIDCLVSGAPFETDARKYLASFATAEADYRSVAESRQVAISELLPAD